MACSGLPRGQYWCSRGRREHFRSLGAPLTEPRAGIRAGIRAGAGPEGRLRALNRQPPRGCPLSRPGHHRLGAQPGTARCTDAPERAPSQAPPPGRPSPDPDRTPPPGTGPGGLGGRGDGEGLLGRGRHGEPPAVTHRSWRPVLDPVLPGSAAVADPAAARCLPAPAGASCSPRGNEDRDRRRDICPRAVIDGRGPGTVPAVPGPPTATPRGPAPSSGPPRGPHRSGAPAPGERGPRGAAAALTRCSTYALARSAEKPSAREIASAAAIAWGANCSMLEPGCSRAIEEIDRP